MALEVTGKLIKKFATQQINDSFKKREFVIEMTEQTATGMTFSNYASFQLTQDKVALIDNFQEGEDLKVSFNIRGNKWEKDGQTRYITNLNAWRIERLSQLPESPIAHIPQQQAAPASAPIPPSAGPAATPFVEGGGDDDLPF